MLVLNLLLLSLSFGVALADLSTCPVSVSQQIEALEEAEAAIARAGSAASVYPFRSPIRDRLVAAIERERQTLDGLIEQLGTDAMVPSRISDLQRRISGLESTAKAPPVRYVNPGHHDPTSANFRGGGARTTPLPSDAERVLAGAIPEAGSAGTVWWGFNGEHYYRYQGSVVGNATEIHWNGTTQGASVESRTIPFEKVPIEVRRHFGKIRAELLRRPSTLCSAFSSRLRSVSAYCPIVTAPFSTRYASR